MSENDEELMIPRVTSKISNAREPRQFAVASVLEVPESYVASYVANLLTATLKFCMNSTDGLASHASVTHRPSGSKCV